MLAPYGGKSYNIIDLKKLVMLKEKTDVQYFKL